MAVARLETINAFLVDSFNDVFEQLTNGIGNPTATFSKICGRGEAGIDLWKSYIETCTGVKFQCTVNAAADTVTLIPLEPMSPLSVATSVASGLAGQITNASQSPASSAAETPSTTTTLASPPLAGAADYNGSAKDKVPRPPNAFIIYRKEWHPKVVKENPNLHNNEISVIIGRKWKAETEAVRNEYKRKAEDAKRQHAIDHPGYQYQPRKPSEKKKRMTKTKLAKLRAQANAATTPDPMKDLNELLAGAANDKQVTVNTFQAPHRQGFPNLQPSQEDNNHLTFDANGEQEILLYNELAAWNANNPGPSGGLFPEPAVLESQPLADGQKAPEVPQLEVPYSFVQTSDSNGTTSASATCSHDATAEVERQQHLADALFDGFFDFDAFVLQY